MMDEESVYVNTVEFDLGERTVTLMWEGGNLTDEELSNLASQIEELDQEDDPDE
jgi:hypothetical protein